MTVKQTYEVYNPFKKRQKMRAEGGWEVKKGKG